MAAETILQYNKTTYPRNSDVRPHGEGQVVACCSSFGNADSTSIQAAKFSPHGPVSVPEQTIYIQSMMSNQRSKGVNLMLSLERQLTERACLSGI